MLLLMAATLVFTSCSDDEEEQKNPTITVDSNSTPESTTLKPGADIKIKFSATKGPDGKKIDEVRLEISQDGGTYSAVSGYPDKGTDGKGIDADNYQFDKTFSARTVQSGTDAYRITVLDKDGNSATRTLTYKIEATAVIDSTPVSYNNITLSNANGYFSTSNGTRYNEADAEANATSVDVTYFFSGTSGNNLASAPARSNNTLYGSFAITWGSVGMEYRTTSMTKADFDAIDNTNDIAPAFNSGTPAEVTGGNAPGSRITSVAGGGMGGQFKAGSVIAFKSGLGAKHGLIYINSVAADESGSSSLSFKREK